MTKGVEGMIIETKLLVPETKGRLVTRTYLFRYLDEGLNSKLTLVTAPAGYGKSTLLSEWTKTIETKVAWVSLDPNDNHPLLFWKHIMASLEPLFAEQLKPYYSNENRDETGGEAIAVLINLLNRSSEEIVLIWDDFQIVDNRTILKDVTYFIKNLPPMIHVYLASQVHPAISLSHFRIKGELIEINTDNLRFGAGEVDHFFRECTDLSLQENEVTSIYTQTEGWVAGLRVAALSLKNDRVHLDRMELIRKMMGKNRDMTDYFLEEVFMKQSQELQEFLLKTSILGRMNTGLVDAITAQSNGRQILQELEQENLFLVSLDHEREWYRYHHLFQAFLQMQLKLSRPQEVLSLHISAGSWLEHNGFMEEALHHYLSSENYEEAMHLLQGLIPSLPYFERLTLHKWLQMIPKEWLIQCPMFFLIHTSSLFISGNVQEAANQYWWAVNELKDNGNSLSHKVKSELQAGLDFLIAFRSFLERDFDSFVIASKSYLEKEPDGSLLVGIGFDRDGYHPVLDIYISDGNMLKAEKTLQVLLKMWSETKNKPFYAHLCMDYGKLLCEQNQLIEAEEYISEALAIGNELSNVSLVTKASLMMVQINAAQNRLELVEMKLAKLSQYVEQQRHTAHANDITLCKVQITLRHGEIEHACNWLQKNGLSSTDEITIAKVKDYEVLARVLRDQEKIEEAMELTNRLLYLVDEGDRRGEKVRFTLYKSLLCRDLNRVVESYHVLEEVLSVTGADKYIRTFLNEGTAMKNLLMEYVASIQNHHYTYVKRESFINAKNISDIIARKETNTGDKSPLTKKERLVLGFIQDGLSNKRIALEMDVSLSTVKTHINNMYRKLGVNNRVLALQKARGMNIF
jgi:LuxR family maltose regulon positive regulatory protein